jgi:hypothetical protein
MTDQPNPRLEPVDGYGRVLPFAALLPGIGDHSSLAHSLFTAQLQSGPAITYM